MSILHQQSTSIMSACILIVNPLVDSELCLHLGDHINQSSSDRETSNLPPPPPTPIRLSAQGLGWGPFYKPSLTVRRFERSSGLGKMDVLFWWCLRETKRKATNMGLPKKEDAPKKGPPASKCSAGNGKAATCAASDTGGCWNVASLLAGMLSALCSCSAEYLAT